MKREFGFGVGFFGEWLTGIVFVLEELVDRSDSDDAGYTDTGLRLA